MALICTFYNKIIIIKCNAFLSFVNCSEWRGRSRAPRHHGNFPTDVCQLVKCAQTGVSQTRRWCLKWGTLAETTHTNLWYLCGDSGWCVSESNCSTAGKNYKECGGMISASMLKTDWRGARADTGGDGLGGHCSLSDGGFRPRGCDGDTEEWLYSLRLSMLLCCWRAGVGISQWLDGAWFYYWGLSCLIWSAVDTQVVSLYIPPLR